MEIAKPIETNAMELELMVEDELARLQRQYRIMESDRVAYLEHIQSNMGKQNNIIYYLSKERNSLLLNLQVADSKNNKRKDENNILQLKQLLCEHNCLADKIKIRKTYVTELDYQIRKVQKQIVTLRFDMRKLESSRHERIAIVKKNLIKLENKLETSNNRYGLVLSQNKGLRQEIDHLLNERRLFNKNWQFLFLCLETSKKFMLDLIEQATLAYDHREEWCQKLEALKCRANADLQYHSEEMRDLQRTLDHDVGLQNFLNVKGQRRIAENLLKKELMKREEAKIRLKEQTEKYSKILQDIQEFAGSENVDHLASQFLKQEEENFALFNYIHELNSELESLADSIGAVKIKIDEQKEMQIKRSTKQIENIEYLRHFLIESTSTADEAQEQCLNLNESLHSVFVGIGRLFLKINCDKAPILDLLGQVVAPEGRITCTPKFSAWICDPKMDVANVEVGNENSNVMTVHNVQLYLGILENTISDMVKMIFYTQTRKKKNAVIMYDVKSIEKAKLETINTPCPLCYESLFMSRTHLVTFAMSLKEIRRTLRNCVDDNPRMRHHVSHCDLPAAVETLKKRFESTP